MLYSEFKAPVYDISTTDSWTASENPDPPTFWMLENGGTTSSNISKLTFTPTSCSNLPGVWRCESWQDLNFTFLVYDRMQHYECLETVWQGVPLVPYLNDHRISPLFTTTSCSFHLPVWPYGTAYKPFCLQTWSDDTPYKLRMVLFEHAHTFRVTCRCLLLYLQKKTTSLESMKFNQCFLLIFEALYSKLSVQL